MVERPTGTVTFLFTDIEGSTRRWQDEPEAMRVALAQHDAILREVVDKHHGHLFKHTEDGIAAAFVSAPAALSAAVEAQLRPQAPQGGVHKRAVKGRLDYFSRGPIMAADVSSRPPRSFERFSRRRPEAVDRTRAAGCAQIAHHSVVGPSRLSAVAALCRADHAFGDRDVPIH